MAWKSSRISAALLLCIASVALRAAAQEPVYSANSLMAAFDRGSRVSPKGTQITFHDVVVESEDGKLTFKSGHNNRVICRLVPSTADRNKASSVGKDVTVTGKVRGRGLLGNVTLDNCSLAHLTAADEHPASPQHDEDTIPAVVPPVELSQAASQPPLAAELTNFQPLPSAEFTKSQPPRAAERTKSKLPRTAELAKESALIDTSPLPGPSQPEATQQLVPLTRPEQQAQPTRTDSVYPRGVSYRFYALLVLSGAVGYMILAKLLSLIARPTSDATYIGNSTPDQARKAALQALLLKTSKKR